MIVMVKYTRVWRRKPGTNDLANRFHALLGTLRSEKTA